MPYISRKERKQYDRKIRSIAKTLNDSGWPAGHLNYVIFSLLVHAIGDNKCYDTINKLGGVVKCVWDEFYRRHAAPYEDFKVVINGDVLREDV